MVSVVLWDCMGEAFFHFCATSKKCLGSRRLSLDEDLRATEGGKDKTSLFFLLPMVSPRSKRFRSS